MNPLEIISQVYGAAIVRGGNDTFLPLLSATRGVEQSDGLPVLLNVQLDKETWN